MPASGHIVRQSLILWAHLKTDALLLPPARTIMQTQMRLTAQPALVARGSRSQAPVCASSFMGSKLPAKGDSVAELRGSVRRRCAPAAVEVRTAAASSAPGV